MKLIELTLEAGMPSSIIKHKQKLAMMTDKEFADSHHGSRDEESLRKMAWSHGYGNMSPHYWNRVQRAKNESLDEGIKDWAQKLAAAGVIVGAVAGMGSINNAIDNSVPAVKALNTAYELAVDQGHDDLAKDIKNDLSAVKIRLSSGKDLNFVKDMQHKYSKFVDAKGLPYSIDTEGLAYESKLAVQLKQRLK